MVKLYSLGYVETKSVTAEKHLVGQVLWAGHCAPACPAVSV